MRLFNIVPMFIVIVSLFATGCASTLKVVSDPPGAMVRVRGCGRPSYKWKSAGITPCEFTVPYSKIQIYASWNDRVCTDKVVIPMHGHDKNDPIVFTKPR